MPPPQLPPESYYDPKKTQKIFAIVSVILLLSLIGLFAKDYSREWKNYQRKFRALEAEKATVKVDAEDTALASNSEYQETVKALAEAQKAFNSQAAAIGTIKKEVHLAEVSQKLHTQNSQFAKAKFDALRYKYESAEHKGASDAPKLKKELQELAGKIEHLRVQIEADDAKLKVKNDELATIQKAVKDLEKKKAGFTKKKDILENKLKRIDMGAMSSVNQFADMVRDLPVIDLANPNYKVRQIVVKDIPEDVNFMRVQRVDRCTTCHLGIDNPDFKNAAQPFRSHPNLEMFVDKNSPHPVEQFACTTCHMGRGRATDFIAAAHTPRSEEQRHEWEKKYNWRELEHWANPMLPVTFTQASCFKCHKEQEVVKGAEKLNMGMALIERAGCYGCHEIDKYHAWPKTGPSLEFLASKTTPEWAYHWIEDPKAVRFNAWMPSYFNLSNNNDPQSIARGQQEIHAMVSFLFNNSKPFNADAEALTGDALKGKELVSSIGCLACHQAEEQKKDEPARTRDSLHREFGPNLIGLGSKTSQAWLYQWLKDPKRYHGETRMPDMRLTDQEAADIAAYLIKDTSPIVNKPIPVLNEKVLNSIVMDFLKKTDSIADSEKKLGSMDVKEKQNFAGQRLIREYGCYACHKIPGFENEKPIGVELTEEGSKSKERLDFGFTKIEHNKQAWFKQKILDPRIFDVGKTVEPLDRLKMPNFHFTEEEAQAVTTVIMGMVKDYPDPAKMPNKGVKGSFITEGQKTVRQFNCQGCHIIEGEGGVVENSIAQWLETSQGRSANDAKAVVRSFAPPTLLGEGAKVQADWLFGFLHDPSVKMRPWLHVRMPTYGFHSKEINTLVKYFNYLDDEDFPFTTMHHANLDREEFDAAEHLMSVNAFDCAKCHVFGKSMPHGSADSWGPDLLLSKRLKPEWIIRWITNPSAVLPGTKMPTFFDPNDFENAGPPDVLAGDEHRQIKALRDYLLTISSDPEAAAKVVDALSKQQPPKPAEPTTQAKDPAASQEKAPEKPVK